MKRNTKWCLLALVLAALLCGAASAAETEQVLLPGDEIVYQPASTRLQEIDGVPTLTKVFVLPSGDDPEILREEPFSEDGTIFRYERMDRSEHVQSDNKTVSEEVRVEAPSDKLADVIDQFPSTRSYSEEGYAGTLLLDIQSIKVEATSYSTVTDSHPHSITKTYTLERNDRSLVPETVQAEGLTLPMTSLKWDESQNVEDSDVPATWLATAVYSKTTYSSRQVADGYQATATYRGEVSKSYVDNVTYTVTYLGSKIPLAPFLSPEVTVPQIVIVVTAAALLLLLLVVWFIRWHIARIYVYNDDRRIHDVVARQYVRVKTPKVRLAALQGHAETEYTVILRRHLAKRLVGRDIAIETGGEGQHHVVESFVGSDYAFQVRI